MALDLCKEGSSTNEEVERREGSSTTDEMKSKTEVKLKNRNYWSDSKRNELKKGILKLKVKTMIKIAL